MTDPRYHRQLILPEIGEDGQHRLAHARVLLVGCGALGCVTADLLARAGVGRLTIVDRDIVERTNLQRQTLFDERDAREGLSKAEAAAKRLAAVNSSIRIDPLTADFSAACAESIFDDAAAPPHPQPADLLIDGTDNFTTRYLLNDLAVKRGVPLIYGGAVGTTGLTMTIRPGITPCLRCLFPHAPDSAQHPTCDTAGILAPVSAIIGAMQALEAIKVIVGASDQSSSDLVDIDPWHNRTRRVSIAHARSPSCDCCARRSFEYLEGRHEHDASVICTRHDGGAVQIRRPDPLAPAIDLARLQNRLAPHGDFARTPQSLRGVLAHESGDGSHPIELTIFSDGRAVIRGTVETARAHAIYARYIGE